MGSITSSPAFIPLIVLAFIFCSLIIILPTLKYYGLLDPTEAPTEAPITNTNPESAKHTELPQFASPSGFGIIFCTSSQVDPSLLKYHTAPELLESPEPPITNLLPFLV